MLRQIMGSFFGVLLFVGPTVAQTLPCPSYTYTFSSASNAVAAQVNSNFANVLSCFNYFVSGTSSGATLSGVTLTGTTTSTGLFGIGMSPSNVLDVSQSQNGYSIINILNSNPGGGAVASVLASNSVHNGGFSIYGASFSSYGIIRADGLFVGSAGAGGVTLATGASQPIYFGIDNGEVARFDLTGRLLVGYTADQGGGQSLQVNSGAVFASTLGLGGYSAGALANGQGEMGANATNGAVFYGKGSAYDAYIGNDIGNPVLVVPTGTTQAQLPSLAGTGNRMVYSDASGNLTNSSSDAGLKANIAFLTNGLSEVEMLKPVAFNWRADLQPKMGSQREIGFLAQNVQRAVPEVVGTNSDGTLSVDYPKLVAVLTSAIQNQQKEIDALKACRLWCMVKQAIAL